VLAKNRRENLVTHVKEARKLVEDAFDRALVGLGLPKNRDPLPAERITNPAKQVTRKAVDEVMARDCQAGGMSYVDARRHYLEHCAFTLVNRVAALRAMEVRGFLPKTVIAQNAQYGGLSAWARDILEAGTVEILGESIAVRTADDARLQAIRAACVAASRDVAIVFDLQDEYSVLAPEPAAIKGLLVELTETVTADDWAADDILGWVYQYYNVSANAEYKERKKRRGYKMSADDMIVANQFYTPHWVVRVLVDNTLGRIWWESIPDLARKRLGEQESDERVRHEEERLRKICRETCSYLVPLPDEQRLGWWGEEARSNAEARAVAEARKRFDAAAVKPERGPIPAPPSVPPRSWKPVRELKIIDPACGSAHFLLYVFDVLRRMYEIEPKSDRPQTADVPSLILAENLHGIDVDLRACQLGTFNLYLKARLAFREITGRNSFHPAKLNIVCAGARITEGEDQAELLSSFESTPLARELAEGILDSLSKTAEIGSLLKVREKFEPLLRRQRLIQGKPVQSSLFGESPAYQRNFIVDREIEELSLPQVLDRLKGFESEARPRGDVGKLLFAHEMAKSCGMVDLLTRTYDVALMNPPYGKMPEACKDYCKGNRRRGIPAHYPNTGNNLYSAFMEKSIDLVDDSCFIGMITSQTYMYLGTFKKCRRNVLNALAPPEVLCDTGYGVLDGAKVITAVAILRKQSRPDISRPCVAFRMFQETEDEKEAVFVDALSSLWRGQLHSKSYLTSVSTFMQLPSSVYSYWVPPSISQLFAIYPPLDRDIARRPDETKIADAKVGLQTGDNPRFVRQNWEVSPDQIARSREETRDGRPWVPFARGGWLDAFQSDIDKVVDWKNDGEVLREFSSAAVRNDSFCFKRGLSWHKSPSYPSNQNRMNIRVLPEGTIFTVSVNGLFLSSERCWNALGYLNSKFVFYLIRVFEMRQVLNGAVALLPYPDRADLESIGTKAFNAFMLLSLLRTTDEVSPFCIAPSVLQATRGPDGLGRPSGHVHSTQFQWPNEEAVQLRYPELTKRFLSIYEKKASPNDSLRQICSAALLRKQAIESEIASMANGIDDEVYDLMGIDPHDRRHFAEEIAFRQCLPPMDEDDDEGDDTEVKAESGSQEEGLTEDVLGETPTESNTAEHREAASAAPQPSESVEDAAFIKEEVARLLSYAVKLVVERDPDGIVPIQPLGQRPGLARLVKAQLSDWFGRETVEAKWAEAGEILSKPVEDWLAQDFFDFHVNMYRRRPIFWQLTSAGCLPRGTLPGAFSCLLHYHKLRANTLQDVVAHYLVDVIETAQAQFNATKTVLDGLQQRGARRRDINDAQGAFQTAERQYRELIEFRRRIQDLDTGVRPNTPAPGPDAPWLKQKIAEVTGGPAYGRGWLPVLDYGVRVNIEPLKVAGILPRAADRIE